MRAQLEEDKDRIGVLKDHIEGLLFKLRMADAKAKKQDEELPENEKVKAVLTDWREKTGHKGASIRMSSDRADWVRRALKEGEEVEDLLRVNKGAAAFPWVAEGGKKLGEQEGRRMAGPVDPQRLNYRRYDWPENIYKNVTIRERLRRLADFAEGEAEADWITGVGLRSEQVIRSFKLGIHWAQRNNGRAA